MARILKRCPCPEDQWESCPHQWQRAGTAAGFGVYLDGLRERQRRKYSFIAKLDAAFGREGSYP